MTGGTGFIGGRLCEHLAPEGHRISVLTRNAKAARKRLPDSVKLIESLSQLNDNDTHFDVLVNLAGEPLAAGRWNPARKQRFRQSRVSLTRDMLTFFRTVARPPEVLINGSAIGYYGPHDDELLDETGHGVPCFSHALCRDWETAADGFAELGTRVCKIRIGIVLGPNGGALKQMLTPFRLGLGGPMGSGRQWMSWIHREDLLRLLCHCINHTPLLGVLNGTAPNPVRNAEFARCLAALLGRSARLRMPAAVLSWLMGDMAEELLLSGQQVVPARALESGFSFRFPELSAALKDVLDHWN